MDIPVFPVTGHLGEDPDSILFAPSLQVFLYIDKIPPELLSSLVGKVKSWICSSDANKQFHKWLVKTWEVALRNKWHK